MKTYKSFAAHYDSLTQNVDYAALCEHYAALISRYGNGGNIVLDLACGTGSLSVLLAKSGYDVVGVDASEEMLSLAMNKVESFGNPIFLNQTMQELDLFGTIDAAICSLDSINHLKTEADIKKAVERVSLFLNPNGLFIFDVNTLYKHREILGNNTFVYDTDDVYCVWQNAFNDKNGQIDISLDFFSQDNSGKYTRSCENFSEYYYSDEFLMQTLEENSLKCIVKLDDFTQNPAKVDSQRVLYVCRKE